MTWKKHAPRRLSFAATAALLAVFLTVAAVLPDPPWNIVVVGDDEPGEPLVVTGIVYGPEGQAPRQDIHVHVYHTDAAGRYAPPDAPTGTHRLRGDMKTNEEGRYQYRTIKPGAYPTGRTPSHVHYVVSGEGFPEQRFELFFEGDPLLPARIVEQEKSKGRFSAVQPVTRDDEGVLRATLDLRLKP